MSSNKKKIIIVGAGWYGLYSAMLLKNKYDITILEKQSDIFNNSSYYNQNRLHLGYHYPRNYATRKICLDGYNKFINKFPELIDCVEYNNYIIAKSSFIDYETFLVIFNENKKYDHTIIENKNTFASIDGNIIKTNEKIINSKKTYNYFKNKIDDKLIKLNYTVEKIIKKDNKIVVNDELECDYLLDCTYNQLNLSKDNYFYEITISLIYKKIKDCPDFDALTCMDGDFFSIYPRNIEDATYTLTNVKYTPLIKSKNIDNIKNYVLTEEKVSEIIKNMENEVEKYYKQFKTYFKYDTYFTSYKCKKISSSDSRDITIENNNNIISVNCGKITGIFCLEDYLVDFFKL